MYLLKVALQGHLSPGEKTWGSSGHFLGARARSLGEAAPSSLDTVGGLGVVALVGSSTLSISEGTVVEEMVAMGSFLTPSHISFSMLNKSPFSTMGTRQLWISCTTLQNAFGEVLA